MPAKPPRLQPATREKSCQVCGANYTYPERGSTATRFHCELCAGLDPDTRKVLQRLAQRVQQLERTVDQLSRKSP